MLKTHDYVCEIAREINLELRDVYLTLERLGYIERGAGEWIPTDTGGEMFSLRKISYLISEIEVAFEDEKDKEYLHKKAEAEKASERIECDRCHQLRHPNEFGKNSDICTPCVRRYYAIQSRV